jgi:hypothetical protein
MKTKLQTLLQVSMLEVGSTLTRFPTNGTPAIFFDEQQTSQIDIYSIRSYSRNSDVFELVISGTARGIFESPGEIGRLFITSANLTDQDIWWI